MLCFAVLVMEKFDCACGGGFLSCFEAEVLVLSCGGDGEDLRGRVLWSLK